MAGYSHFGRFLDRYLHRDFRALYDTQNGAARVFRSEAPADEVAQVLAELEQFLAWAETVPTRTWQVALAELGGAWRPRTLGPLRALAGALRSSKRWLAPGEKPVRSRRRFS
jgi:hypothetical protein